MKCRQLRQLYETNKINMATLIHICVRVALTIRLVSSKHTAEVKLRDGLSPNQGLVEVKYLGEDWRPLQDGSIGNVEAAIVCRQLGYQYGISQPGAYKTSFPDFLMDKITCSGKENELGECKRTPGPPISANPRYFYAGVCCSKFPDFQESTNGIVLGHCSVPWNEALQRCEEKNMALSWSPHHASSHGDRFWTGEFFTAWIWSDGCYTIEGSNGGTQSFQFNSPQVCLQYCGDTRDTQFALSGDQCKCLGGVNVKVGIRQTSPSMCNNVCQGDPGQKCGDHDGKYWNLFSLGRQNDIFYTVDDPVSPSQCAVLLTEGSDSMSYKLRSEQCSVKNGYICSALGDDETILYIRFGGHSIYNVTLQESRQRCDASRFHLTGRDILHATSIDDKEQYNRKWVNIQRTVTTLQLPNDKLSPSLCTFVDLIDDPSYKRRPPMSCVDRNLYMCIPVNHVLPDKEEADTTFTGTHSTTGSTTSQGISTAPFKTETSYTLPLLHIVIAVAVGVVLIAVLVAVVVCCRWKQKQKNERLAISAKNDIETGYELIQQKDSNTEGFYDEILDQEPPPEDHVYLDLDEANKEADLLAKKEIEQHDENELLKDDEKELLKHDEKELLKEKISYAFPKDSLKEKHSGAQSKDSVVAKDYDTPYDTLLRKKVEEQEKSKNEIHASDGT